MDRSHDVIVIGGGAIGAACARELALGGRSVLVLERGEDAGQAWRAAAGMLAPQIEADGADPLLRLGVAARELYPGLAASLRDSTGIEIGLWQDGIAHVATDPGEAMQLQSNVASQQEQGYSASWLESEEVRRRWPWLGPTAGALWSERDGALDPRLLVEALLADARLHRADIVKDTARSLEQSGGRVTGVAGAAARYRGRDVVVAAGAWSGRILGLPRALPVEPVRGQMAALPWPAEMGRAIVYHKDCYLLARGDEAILGSTMEYVGFQPEVTPDGIARIFAATMALSPSLVRGKLKRTWAGLRPVTPDWLPILGAEPRLPGLWYATGHGRNGILLAGITGMMIREMMDGKPVEEAASWSPTRF